MAIKLKRIYDIPSRDDGKRILVDRLWPRGLSKEKAQVDIWLKEAAPSSELRRWYNHKPERHEEFCKLYKQELSGDLAHRDAVNLLKTMGEEEGITLVYGAKDCTYNHAVVLLEWINSSI